MKLEDLINPKRAEQRRRLAYEEKMRQQKETLESDPEYYSSERYGEVIKPYLDDPIHKEYVTKNLIHLMLTSLREQGSIRSFGGGWRGYVGEEYIMMKSGWTPTVAEDKDPIIFFRKSQAAHYVERIMGDLWDKGVIDRLMAEVLESIDKEFNQ